MDKDDKELSGEFCRAADAGLDSHGRKAGQSAETAKTSPAPYSARTVSTCGGNNLTVRLMNGSNEDYRAGIYFVRKAHKNTISLDIPISKQKARPIIDRAIAQLEQDVSTPFEVCQQRSNKSASSIYSRSCDQPFCEKLSLTRQ